MPKEERKALMQLQQKLIELIRKQEGLDIIDNNQIVIITDDFEFKLDCSKRLKRFLVLISDDN